MTVTPSALSALTATAAQLTAAAASLTEAVAALSTDVPAFTIGQRVSQADLDALPVGSVVRDNDRDDWKKLEVGWRLHGSVSGRSHPIGYAPLTLSSLPAPVNAAPSAMLPLTLKENDGGDRADLVFVRSSGATDGVRVAVTEDGTEHPVHLSREQTRKLADALNAFLAR